MHKPIKKRKMKCVYRKKSSWRGERHSIMQKKGKASRKLNAHELIQHAIVRVLTATVVCL